MMPYGSIPQISTTHHGSPFDGRAITITISISVLMTLVGAIGGSAWSWSKMDSQVQANKEAIASIWQEIRENRKQINDLRRELDALRK